jgi:pimeloyl-ACP methyl ester carboxylesterase
MMPDPHYTSAAGYHAMMAWYEATMSRISVPYRRTVVSTRFGDTHLITAGSADQLPVVLLHGTNVNALVWRVQIAEFTQHFHVIAPDIIGFAGQSAPVRLPYTGDGYAWWLLDVLDQLQIDRAVLIGSSAGGYFALKPAALAPERIAGLVLMNPCGLDHFRAPYTLFELQAVADLVGWFGRRFIATQQTARRMVRLGTSPQAVPDDETVEMALLLVRHYRRYRPPSPLPAHELRRVNLPVLLLLSEYERFLNIWRVIRRAEQVFPLLRTHIIANAGHDMNKEQPAEVMTAILDFLHHIGWYVEKSRQSVSSAGEAYLAPTNANFRIDR